MFRNGRGHWLAPAALSTLLLLFAPAFLFATNPTLGNGADPANASLAPGGPATNADSFTFQTSAATDTVTNVTVTLSAGTFAGLSLVEITNNAGTTVYGSVANPASNTPAIALTTTITATTTSTQYRIRVTPKTAAAMPAPPGSVYSVTAFVSSWTGTGTHTGSDSGGTTITIDNLSPGDVTATNASAGLTDIVLTWTNPADADLNSIIVLRRATNPVANTPVEGVTYSPGNVLGTSTIACVITPPTTTCDDTGLAQGTTYNYKIYTRDTSGNYSAGIVPAGTPLAPKKSTTLGSGADPANATLAPGGVATNADSFTFQTSNSTDAVASVTVTLAAGTAAGLSLVEITNNAGGTVYGSVANPASDTPVITLTTNISATTTLTQYRIRVTPKSHAAMPAPVGSTYNVTAFVSDWVSTNLQAGSDTGGTTITVDNLSPGNVTASTATAGNTQVVLAWTNPADADLASIVVLRRAISAVADTPVEGATYVVGNIIGASTVACVVASPTATCTDSGLTNGTAYHYKIFAKDTHGNYATGTAPTGSPATPNLTTLANGIDPSNASIAPGGPATMADAFTLRDVSGTDTITSVTVTLAAGTFAGLNLVEITNDTGTVVYGTVTDPVTNTPAIPLTTNITVTSTATQYKIRVTPKTHANMPAPAGATYSVTALVSNWTGTNVHAGSDTAGTTVTIDNLSPGNVTASTATAGNAQVSLTWTNPVVADLGTIIVLRRATSAVADTPTEGAVYVVGNTIGASTVACVVTAPTAACTDTGLTNATAYNYKIFTKDTNGNYATGVVPAGSPATPNATTLATGVDPANVALAPGGAATIADAFTLQTAIGTDTITAVTVTLAAGTQGGLSLVEITNDAGTVVYGSVANPATATPAIALTTSITATTTVTQYKIRVTPKTHANMPVPPGSTYSVTALISNWTGTLAKTGSDSAGTTVTIDNLSPGNVTASTAAPGSTQVTLNWTNPADADLGTIIVLRRAGSAVASVPVEGTTYIVGNVIGTSTVACVVSAPTATCTDTGLTNGTAYHYKIYAKDTNGNYATGVVPTGSPATPNVTTLANGVDPANANLAPGGVATLADSFTVQTATGTDTITAVNVTLAAGTSAGLSLVEITNNAGTTVYGSVANPATDTPAIGLTTNISATNVSTQYRIRVTPKSHANMPVPAGSTYSVTALISNWTGTNAHAGSDSGGTTVTIDNQSPGNVTASTATPGNAKVTLVWTNPADADLGTILVLRRAILPVGDTPVEGTTYVVGNTIGASTVACVVAAPTATCTDSGLTDGTAYHYRIFAKDTNGNYATGVVPTGSPATPFAGVTVTPISGLVTTEAGGSATFTMVLTSQPTANVSISLSSSDLTEGTVAPASVTFTSVNWNVAQTVTVTGVDDAVADGTIAYTIVTGAAVSTDPGYNGLAVPGVSVSNTDNDTAGVTVNPVSGLTTTEAGGTATFTIVLKSQPTADVTIPLSSSDLTEGTVAPASVTFTTANWNVAQTVTVTGVDDAIVDGTVAYTIVTGAATSADLVYNGMAVADVSISTTDNDTAGVTVSPTSGLVTTEAGGTATFTMVLTSQPSANVTIPLSSSDLTEGTVSPASVTFTSANWNIAQTVTVTGVDDVIVDGTVGYTIVTGAASSADPTYNGLAVADVSVSTTDNDTAGVNVTPVSGLVTTEAGGTATFTMVLTSQPSANVTIGLTSSDLTEGTVSPASVTFTSANWNIAQTVTVTGVDDAVADGSVAYTIVTGATSSADSTYNGLTVADVSVSTTDNDSVGVTVSPTSGLVTTEAGGTATFTVVLTSQPTADVTIPLSSSDLTEGTVAPASVTFTSANWNIPRTVTVTGVDDAVVDGTVAYSIVTGAATSADPLYNGLAVADVSVSTTDNDTAGVTVTPTSGLITTEAGGTATFTMVLTSQPIGDATILLGSSNPAEGTVSPSSATFTAANWNVPQTITVTGVDDTIVDGTVAYTIVTSAVASADPVYSGLAVADVSVSNTDNDTAGVVVTPTSGLVTSEAGGTATFTMRLTSQPSSNVTIPLSSSDLTEGTVAPASVTFTSANWNIVQTVTVTGVDDAIADGTVAYTIVTGATSSADPTYNGLAVSDVSVSTTDNDTAGVTVSPTSGLITTEAGGTATFTIALNTQPTSNVTIGVTSSDLTEGTVSPASVTFTAVNWNVPQTVTVTGVDDAVVDGTIGYTIMTAAATSADPAYNGMAVADVSVSTTDNDSVGVTVIPTSGLVTSEAGGTATFTMALTSQPTANVSISLTSSNLSEGTVAPASVTFTSANWNIAQTVTVTGVNDAVADGNVVYTIVTGAAVSSDPGYNGLAVPGVSVTNTDNDTAGVTVNPVSGLTTTEAGGTATFTIVLKSQPLEDVTIPLSSSDLTEGTVAPASVTFTTANWNVAQTVTVTGVDDAIVDGTIAYTIVTGAATSADLVYNGMAVADVSVSTTDNDTAGVTVSPTSGLVTTEAGGTATFTMVLTSQPGANVTIPLSSSDLTEGTVSPASVTFTSANWNIAQTVTVTGVDDVIVDGTVAYTIVTGAASSADPTYNGLAVADVSVSTTDNDAAGVTVTPVSGLVTTEAGGTATFTMVLTSQPSANVTIPLSSSDLTEGTVAPASVTFTSANWNVAQTVTVTGVDDVIVDGTVAYTIITGATSSTDPLFNGLTVSDVSVSTTDNDSVGVTVSPTSGLVTTEAGGTATFTVVLTSQPAADVTIPLSSSDLTEGTVSPASITFTSANWNIPRTVTITGVDDSVVDGTVAYSIITGAAASADPLYNGLAVADVSVSTTDNDTAGVIVTPTNGLITSEAGGTATFTMVLTSQLIGDGTIVLSSSNPAEGTVFPASVTFNASNWNVPQTITVTGIDDAVVDGTVAYTIVTSAVASADPVYNGLAVADVSVSNTDNDTANVTVTPTSGLVTTEAGGTATFTVVLTSQPTADVTIPISSSDLTEGTVAPASLTFTSANWNIVQTVTITGVDDAIADGTIAYTIVTGAAVSTDPVYNGRTVADVSVSTTDNDTANVTVVPTTGLITTEAGGAATFTIVLTSQPTANVTVPLSSSNPAEGTVSPASVTFTSANWNVPQTVTVTGVEDAIADGTIAYTIVTGAAASADPVYSGMVVSDVSVSNTDDDTAGVTVNPTTGLITTESGGTDTFTIVLGSQPTANVTIALSSSDLTEGTVAPASVTFTPANWNVPHTVTVTGVDDAQVDGTVAYTIVTGDAVSTDPAYSGMVVPDVSVSTTDNDAASVTVTPTSGLTTTEAGGTASFTMVLTSQPTANVTIPLSSNDLTEGTVAPASITFTPANWNIAQTVTVTGVDDAVVDGTVAYTIVTGAAVSTDPEYNGIAVADVSVSTLDNDAAGVTVTPANGLITTEAGGTATFTIVLSSQPIADVTISLSSSDLTEGTVSPASVTFTSANWNIAKTVTITGVDDAVVDGTVAYTIVTSAAVSTDPVYNGEPVTDVSVSNTDNDSASVTVTPTSGLVTTEAGGTATFTIVLTSQPTADVTIPLNSSNLNEGAVSAASVTFTPADWNVAQTVTVSGLDDLVADGNVAYTIVTGAAISTDPVYNSMTVADVSVTNHDNDIAGVTVTPISGLVTTEAGGTATFTVELTSQPTGVVTIPLSSSDLTEGTVAPATLTFTPVNWNVAQTVTITGVDDLVADGTVAYTIVTGATVSADPVYSNLAVADVSVSTTDNDAAAVIVTPVSGLVTTEAGGTATFTVVLSSQPTAVVTIPLSSSDLTEGTVSPSSLTFTSANWNTAQTVTVTGVDDFVVDGTIAYTIVTGAAASADPVYNNMAVADVSVSTTDNDVAGANVVPIAGLITTEAGGTATFTVVLTSQPVANVTIPLLSTNPAEGTVSPASLTFTPANWNVVQTVTVTGVDDAVIDGDVAYSIVSGAVASTDAVYNNRAMTSVSVTNKDDDNFRADLSVTKTNNVTTVISSDVTHYTITVTNNGPASVTGALLTDPAAAGLTKTSITCSGPAGCPASLSIAALESTGIALGTLANQETVSFDVAATITAANGTVSNTASVAVPAPFVDPVSANNSATDTDTVDPKPDIFVQVTASTSVIELGDTLSYAVRIENRSGPFLPHILAVDKLPRGFRYLPGSALLSSDYGSPVPMADPIGSPGPVLTFSIPAQPAGDGAIVSFRVRVGPGALQGTGMNIVDATALNGTVHSNTAQTPVVISGGVFTPEACVIGKIFADENRNHVQDKKELGIPGVHLIFEDGTILVSDVEGKYSYCGLTPTTHVLKVDRTTLPAGAQLTVSSNRNAGDANSLFVDLKYGEVHRADFIEGSRDPKVLAEIIHRRSAGEVWVPSFQTPKQNAANFADRPAAETRGRANQPAPLMLSAAPAAPPVTSSETVVLGSSYRTEGFDGGSLDISTAALGVIKLSADRAQAPADGSSIINLTMHVSDRQGNSASTPLVATVEATGGRLKLPEGIETDVAGPGTKVRIENGEGVIQLMAPGESQNVHVRVSVDDPSTGALSADGEVSFVPRLRPFVAVGIFEGMVAHSSSDASTDSALPAHDAFDNELQHFARKGDGYAGGRSAMFLKGTVLKNYLLTLSYDSDKAEHGVLFRDIQPEAFYPIYGDASLKVFDAQTSGKFYVRAERGRSYMLYGDFQTVQSPTVAQDLGLYRRTMMGFQQHLEKQKVVLNIFGSHDSLTQVIDEIAGLGISGPYSVSNTSGVSGTEKVEIVTRDRNQPAVILSTVSMTRFNDYEFEPFNGRLLFRRPVPALDELLNPVSIRVTYEVDRGGEKAWVGGIDGHVNLGRFVQVGGSLAEDGTPGAPYQLGSVNGFVKLGKSTTLVAEGAQSSGTVNTTTFNQSGLFNLANEQGSVDGTAGRIELRHESRRVGARLFAGASSSGFNNPASTLTGGRTELSGHAKFTVTKSVRLVGEAIHSEDKLTDGHRDGALLSLETRLTKALGLEFGIRRSKESVNPAQGTSVGTPLFGPDGSSGTGFGFNSGNPNIDPVTGLPIVNPGFAPQLSAEPTPPQTPASLDVLTVRAKVTLKLSDNINLYAEGEQDVRDANKNAAAVGGQLHLTERTRLYLRHEFISSMGSPYGLTDRQSGHNTVFGVSSTFLKNTDAFNEYRMRDSISGREAEAAIGLRNLWKLAEGVNVSTSVERLTTFAGVDRKATAATAGFEYTRSPLFKSTERVEWRHDDISESWVSTIGLARKISRDWSLLSKNYFQETSPHTGPSQTQNRFWIGGAYRQTDTDHLNILTRYEFRYEDGLPQADGTAAQREVHTVSTHADWHPIRTWNFSGQYAAKRVKDSTVVPDSPFLTHLVSGRVGHDVSKRIDLGLLGSTMWSPAGGGRQSALGAEVGYLVHDNMWVSVGYNFTGFSDRDLTSSNETSRGVFVRFRLKFDENLFGKGH